MKTKQIIAASGIGLIAMSAILALNLQASEKAGEKLRDLSNLNAAGDASGSSGCCHQMMATKCKMGETKSTDCKKMGGMNGGMMGEMKGKMKCDKAKAAPGAASETEHHH